MHIPGSAGWLTGTVKRKKSETTYISLARL